MRGSAGKVVAGALALAAFGMGGTAYAADPVITVGADGKTAPVFSYTDSIKERVWIPVPGVDQDANGAVDRVAVDIERPKQSGPGVKVPAIIDDSPYYTSVGRGNETQFIHTTADGKTDFFPLFYDNYFVPRGYAFIAAHAVGTAFSTGCPMHGGPGDVAGFKAVVDWLNGRVPGYTSVDGTTPAVADWHNGKSAMIGKSYDGTFANGVAATGVEGLKTIVPISAISAWYDYSRTGGIRHNTHYPTSLDNTITSYPGVASNRAKLGVEPPDSNARCRNVFTPLFNATGPDGDGDDFGDVNNFWRARDYTKDVSKVKAAVFATHGIQDDNVRFNQLTMWWEGLKANNVPRKLWLLRAGHTDPFESNRAKWVDTLHRWFDYWLQGVDNGITNEPQVTIEDEKDTWVDYPTWPIPDSAGVDLYLRGTSQGTAGTLGGMTGGTADAVTFQETATTQTGQPTGIASETTYMNDPDGAQAIRRTFVSRPLAEHVRLSGTPVIDIQASLNADQANLGAIIVDYGQGTQVTRGGEGIQDLTTRTCWGESSPTDSACYLDVSKPTQTVTQWRVSRAALDSSNRTSLWYADSTPVTIDQKYRFTFPSMPTEHIFKAGHRIGIVIVSNQSGYVAGRFRTIVTLDTKLSKVTLPLVGGYKAAAGAGVTDAETVAPVLGAVPADIAVDATSAAGKAVTYAPPTATDDEDPNPTVTCDPTSGTKFAVGTTTVSCVAKDANGNTSEAKTFKVAVRWIAPVDSTVAGSVPATLALTLGGPASFGPFTAGIDKHYSAQTTANVISTAANASLSVSDPGHLTNGAFSLPEPLGVEMSPASWTGPVSNASVALTFKQHIGANDALRTGTYSKTLTFTLSTTTP